MRLFLFLFACLPLLAAAQTTTVQPDLNRRIASSPGWGIEMMYRLGKDNTVTACYWCDKPKAVRLPTVNGLRNWSYSHYYTHTSEADMNTLLLQALLQDLSRLLYLDRNHDYDLRNDGPPLRMGRPRSGKDTVMVRFNNARVKGAYSLARLTTQPPLSAKDQAMFLGAARTLPGHKKAPVSLWLAEERLNTVEAPLPGGQLSLYLADGSVDGVFGNDESDAAALMPSGLPRIEMRQYSSPRLLKAGTALKEPGGGWQFIQSVDTGTGRVSLAPGPAPVGRLYLGTPLRDHTLPGLLDTTQKTALRTLMAQADYTLLDVWGTWCKGCVLAFPMLDTLHRRYGPRLQIVSLSTSPTPDSAYIVTHPHPWPQLRFTEAFYTYLNPDGAPVYLLFNREGTLLAEGEEDAIRIVDPNFKPPAR